MKKVMTGMMALMAAGAMLFAGGSKEKTAAGGKEKVINKMK